jgi:curved DNA-binding protein CbpA
MAIVDEGMRRMDRAFEVLGIEPTSDGRVIRNAFLRLARIYHPDRFSGMPEDVCAEAERRMKEATLAYEELRGRKPASRVEQPRPHRKQVDDVWAQARRWREAISARRAEDERNRRRWGLWDQLEREARERAESEATLLAQLAEDLGGRVAKRSTPPLELEEPPPRSLLARRLEEAGRRQQEPRA